MTGTKGVKKNWYQRYQEIKPALDAHTGNESINLLIQALAEAQGYEAKALNRMIRAGRFLDRLLGPLEAESMRGGYAHIELLQRLYELDNEAARPYVQMAISKQIKLHELQGLIDQQVGQLGTSSNLKRSKARALTFDHERETTQALLQCGPGFFGVPEGRFIKVERSDLLNQFFLLLEGNQPKVAIFSRLGDSSRREVKAAAELIRLVNTARLYFNSVWIIFPATSKLVHEVAFLANEQGVFGQWLHLATLSPEDAAAITEVTKLQTALDRVMLDYADPRRWRGRALGVESAKALTGSLKRGAWTVALGSDADNKPVMSTDIPRKTWREQFHPLLQTETFAVNNKGPVTLSPPIIPIMTGTDVPDADT
jgi:hypothetical protein